jgi:hypothetical protein
MAGGVQLLIHRLRPLAAAAAAVLPVCHLLPSYSSLSLLLLPLLLPLAAAAAVRRWQLRVQHPHLCLHLLACQRYLQVLPDCAAAGGGGAQRRGWQRQGWRRTRCGWAARGCLLALARGAHDSAACKRCFAPAVIRGSKDNGLCTTPLGCPEGGRACTRPKPVPQRSHPHWPTRPPAAAAPCPPPSAAPCARG